MMAGMKRLIRRCVLVSFIALPLTVNGQQDQSSGSTGTTTPAEIQSSGGEKLSGKQVSSLPLNKRDFSQLLTLASGTTTDTNGAANFTQQLAINGQRGTTAVFAMDRGDTTDPELGGATFANFNVDAIDEIRSESGVMPATVGEGAAGFTEIITKSGTNAVHGDVFEFLRNAALDARNFFDRRSVASQGRIPPFVRNEFGFTNGGPLVLPRLYDGRDRTFYFGQYQGFRQLLGTTQVFPVPTPAERNGIDTTAFPGETLLVPVNPQIATVLSRYPLPNDAQGPYGLRTYATASKVSTVSNQFSIRLDHRLSDKSQLFGRFNLNNNSGPTTNPDQTAIDQSFALRFHDNQRNAALRYTRTPSPNFTSDTLLDWVRSTPLFTTVNSTQPGLVFADGLYEAFNSAAGQYYGAWGNVFQLRQNFTLLHGSHTLNIGFEARLNRDTTIFGLANNGSYTFGGGTAYAAVNIPSSSGLHNVQPGQPLPDTLTAFLTGTPYSFTASVGGRGFPQGNHIGESAARREAYNVWFADHWKATKRLALDYGLRYEATTRIHEGHHLTSAPAIVGPDGRRARSWDPGAQQQILVNPQPPYASDWGGWGPRASLEFALTPKTTLHAGAGITTILINLFQDDGMTGSVHFVLNPYFTALPGAPVPFSNSVLGLNPPAAYTPQGQVIFTGASTAVPANTVLDLNRLEQDLAALSPGHQAHATLIVGQGHDFQNGYIETYTAGLDHTFGDLSVSLSYTGTQGVKLVNIVYPNNFPGADPAFAPFTQFDAAGHVVGGIGPEYLYGNPGHSTFHAGSGSVTKTSARFGLGFQANYTFSRSIDNSSSVLGGFLSAVSGPVLQVAPQDPRRPALDKGRSTFDLTHVFTASLIQNLPLHLLPGLRSLPRLSSGWQLLSISTLTSGAPFTVFSGIQQTGLGSAGADRPDQVGDPVFSTSRSIREDYFGGGARNGSYFFIPLNVAGGSGPNHGRLGTLGRSTFRGPAYHNFDLAVLKETDFGRRGSAEAVRLQIRAEFFNAFNIVNFGIPNNILQGSGFGLISRTAGNSRQVQFSLKLIY
jgi:hypothetical protein